MQTLPQYNSRVVLLSAWFFILFVTLVDLHFAYANLDTMPEWEMNRVILAAIASFGFPVIAAARLLMTAFLTFACVYLRNNLAFCGTQILVVAHVYLFLCYLAIGVHNW